MTTLTLSERREQQSINRCKSRLAPNNRGGGASSDSDILMKQILKDLRAMPQEQLLKRIASLPEIRRGKVLNICRQIRQGDYSVENRLDRTIDRVLEMIIA